MDEKMAMLLLGKLEERLKCFGIIELTGSLPKKKEFLNLLTAATITPSSLKFYDELPELPENDQCLVQQNSSNYSYISLRRVLNNARAESYQLSRWKQVWEAFIFRWGIYSSDVLTRKLRVNKYLTQVLINSKHPFSLLCKLKTFEVNHPDERLYVTERPILVIPDLLSDHTIKILSWEIRHTIYKKEVGFLFRHLRRIWPRHYFSHA
jgi:hypothetical protein